MHRRITTALTMGVREFRRTPVLLALLAVLPVYWIGGFTYIVPDTAVPMTIAGESVTIALPDFVAVLLTPVTAALLSGIVGLFLMQSSKAADDRLHLAGYRSYELIVSRVGLLAVGGLVVATVCLAVVLVSFTPVSLLAFVGSTVLTALIYGTLGVIVGVILDKLAGVYVMLFAPMIDVFVFQNPMATDSPTWVQALPGHFVTKATMDAAFTSGFAVSNLVGAAVYLGALLLLGSTVFYQATVVE